MSLSNFALIFAIFVGVIINVPYLVGIFRLTRTRKWRVEIRTRTANRYVDYEGIAPEVLEATDGRPPIIWETRLPDDQILKHCPPIFSYIDDDRMVVQCDIIPL